jgi:hypothetical protein
MYQFIIDDEGLLRRVDVETSGLDLALQVLGVVVHAEPRVLATIYKKSVVRTTSSILEEFLQTQKPLLILQITVF